MKTRDNKNRKSRSRSRRRKSRLGKSFYKYLGFGVLMYLVFLITTLPASTVYSFVFDTPQKMNAVRLTGISGTVWNGHAADATINGLRLGKLQWDLHAIPLLVGKMSFDVKFASASLSGRGGVGASFAGDLFASKFEFNGPISTFAPLLYGLPISLDGKIAGRLENLEVVKGKTLMAKGRIVVSALASVVPQRIELGDLVLKLTPDAAGTKININDQGGPLFLQGNLNVQGNGQYNINLGITARSTASTQLKSSLKFLGNPDSAGKYYFKKNGKIRGW